MNCSKCGFENREGANFCQACGQPMRPYQSPGSTGPTYYYPPYQSNPYNSYPQFVEHKDPVVALLLALILPGAGHIYAGEVKKGIIILAFFMIIGIIITLGIYALVGSMGGATGALLIVAVVASVASGLIWLYQVYDAYQAALRYDASRGLSRF